MKNPIVVALVVLLSFFTIAPDSSRGQETLDSNRKVITKVIPQYPNFVRSMNLEGVVRADVLVGPDGKPRLIEVKGGHPVLVECAENALRQWKWEPASHESHVIVELRFKP